MASTEYYRNTKWNKKIEEHFFSKLNRARTQKTQYLAIQAGMLVTNHPNQALKLIDYYFEIRKDKFHDNTVYWSQAKAFMSLDRIAEAMVSYKQVIKREEEFPNSRTYVLTEFPYVVATNKIEKEYEYALEALMEEDESYLGWPLIKFMHHATIALILNDKNHAQLALDAAEIKQSGLRYHQNLGLVGKEYKQTVKKLHNIVTNKTLWEKFKVTFLK